jgi:ketosteroid isomerase-like protein
MGSNALSAVANRLVELGRSGQTAQGLDELYAPDVVSVEAAAMPGMPAAITGLDALRAKHAWWYGAFEVHGGEIDGPFLHGEDRFAVIYAMDATERATGKRTSMKEVGVYTVANGRIVREEFFYT